MRAAVLFLVFATAACTNDDADQWIAGSSKQREEHAQRLFVDYRDPVFAVLKAYLGDFRDPKRHYQIHVSVFDKELDSSLRARLAVAGIGIEPGWGCYEGARPEEMPKSQHPDAICINIPGIQSVGNSRYRVPISHFERVSVDHSYGASAVVQLTDGQWQVLELEAK